MSPKTPVNADMATGLPMQNISTGMKRTTVREADIWTSRGLDPPLCRAHARAARINPLPYSLLIVALTATLFALVPLAAATPVDPTWIAGLYDNGDHDDVVLAITDSAGLQAIDSSNDSPREPSRRLVAAPPSTAIPEPSRIRLVGRAPPLSLISR